MTPSRDRLLPQTDQDDGIGLIEIIVCMFLMGVIALSFIPLFVQGLKMSAHNATVATATQIVSEQLEIARATAATCQAFGSTGYGIAPPTVSDRRGTTYQATRVVGACPGTYPGIALVTVRVSAVGSADILAESSTYIRMLAAS